MPPRRYRLEPYNRPNYRYAAAAAPGAAYATNSAWNYVKNLAIKEATVRLKRQSNTTRKTRSDKGKPRASRSAPRAAPTTARFTSFTGRGNTSLGTFGSNMTKFKRPMRGNAKSKYGKVTVSKYKGKRATASYRQYPEKVYQKFYLSTPNMDGEGKIIKWLDRRYTNSSVSAKHLTGLLFNVGCVELNWDPILNRIGNSWIPAGEARNPLFQINEQNTDVESLETMITQNNLPETSTPYNVGTPNPLYQYTLPNSVLTGIQLDLTLSSASAQTQYLTVKILRGNGAQPVIPGDFNATGTAAGNLYAVKELMNRHNATSGKEYQTIYQTTVKLPGLAPSTTKMREYRVKKFINMDYARSTFSPCWFCSRTL